MLDVLEYQLKFYVIQYFSVIFNISVAFDIFFIHITHK